MTISARLAGDRGMPTWQLVLVRSVMLTVYALWRIARTQASLLGSSSKCGSARASL